MTGFHSLFANIAPFFILLGLLIFVHELGHFLVAKFFGVRVETFSLGFGKKVLSFKRGDTTYCLSLIPLGGYVKMFGDDPSADVPAAERPFAFLHKPILQRIAIVLAGPLMNLFFAIALFTAIGGLGTEMAGPFLGDVAEGTKAYEAGFRAGDKVLRVNGVETPTWNKMSDLIEQAGGRAIQVDVERKGEPQPLKLDVAVSFGENDNIFSSSRQVGQIPGFQQESRSTLIGVKSPDTPAARAGLRSLDLITAVNGKKVDYWRDLQPAIFAALDPNADGALKLEVREIKEKGGDGEKREVTVNVPKGWDEKTSFADYLGFESAELYIFDIKKGTPAEKAGLARGDRVVRIGADDVYTWNDVLARVKGFDPGVNDGLDFTVVRDGQEKTIRLAPEMTTLMTAKGQEEKRFTVGITSGYLPAGPEPVVFRLTSPVAMLKNGVSETLRWTEIIAMGVVRLVQGEVSAKNVGGIITIGRVASHSFAAGLVTFLQTMAVISINLFLINLLPVPVLDGGHLVFYAYEGLRGAPLSMRKMELAQQIGLMLLMCLMVFAFYNDISNYIASRW